MFSAASLLMKFLAVLSDWNELAFESITTLGLADPLRRVAVDEDDLNAMFVAAILFPPVVRSPESWRVVLYPLFTPFRSVTVK